MIDAGGRSGSPCWQPPGLRHKKIGADEGDQPDYDEQNEAHCARPPKWFPEPSPRISPKFQKRNAKNSNRGEYITAFSQRKQLLASIISCCCSLLFRKRSKSFLASAAIT